MTKNIPEPAGPERYVYKGFIVSVVNQDMKIGGKKVTFEKARRAPGVRLIIRRDDKLLISKEYRHETDSYDYRLPGGKVFDSLKVYLAKLNDESDLETYVLEAARREAHEEAGLEIEGGEIIYTSVSGATINWDLYYVEVEDFVDSVDGQELEMGEDIDTLWVTSEKLKELIRNGDFSEDRSVGVLYRFGFID